MAILGKLGVRLPALENLRVSGTNRTRPSKISKVGQDHAQFY